MKYLYFVLFVLFLSGIFAQNYPQKTQKHCCNLLNKDGKPLVDKYGRPVWECLTILTDEIYPYRSCDYTLKNTEASHLLALKLKPNPVQKEVLIECFLKTASDVKITLLDIAGKVAYETSYPFQTSGKQEYSLSLEGINDGVYLLNLQTIDGNQHILLEKIP